MKDRIGSRVVVNQCPFMANNGHEQAFRLRPLAEPAEIDHVVAFLCSPLASAINGAVPLAYGGMDRSLF